MTRKHFTAIAEALRSLRPERELVDSEIFQQWMATVMCLADVAATYNYRFDKQKFIDACGGLF